VAHAASSLYIFRLVWVSIKNFLIVVQMMLMQSVGWLASGVCSSAWYEQKIATRWRSIHSSSWWVVICWAAPSSRNARASCQLVWGDLVDISGTVGQWWLSGVMVLVLSWGWWLQSLGTCQDVLRVWGVVNWAGFLCHRLWFSLGLVVSGVFSPHKHHQQSSSNKQHQSGFF